MATLPLQPAIFFDRDGTLIEDFGYLRSPSEVVFYEDTLTALRKLKSRYLLFIVTNQPGIGRGILRYEEVERVNQYIVEHLALAGVTIAGAYYCPHTRDQGCECIKPKPYFLLKAAQEFNVDLSRSFVVGDHPHDPEMARNVGAKGVYLLTGHGEKHLDELNPNIYVAKNLGEAAEWIIQQEVSPSQDIQQAAEIIKKGGLVAFPTETVYGLGANAFNSLAVARIFEVKGRPYFDPLIVHVASYPDLERLAIEIPSNAIKLMERFWPGPLTLVLLKKEEVPEIVTAGLPSVAVRMPKHPMALALIKASGCPIAAPSANLFGYVSPTTADHVRDQLSDQVDFILDGGPCEVGLESTIISFVEGEHRLLRPGGVPLEEIESVIGKVRVGSAKNERPSAPGMFPKHYAPRTPILLDWHKEDLTKYRDRKVGLLAFQKSGASLKCSQVEVLSERGDLREAAANLFAAIRRLDSLGLDLILAESVPETGLGRAIMDRLRRASGTVLSPQDSIHTYRGKGKWLDASEDLLEDRRLERREEDEQ
jgi:L-threonylcarbamoyladenylate synthase